MQKPHEERRACTYATFLQLSSLLGSNVNRVKKHRSLGEEELNRLDKHHLSQSALVTLLASDWTTLQCNYMPTLEDCKPQNRYKGIRQETLQNTRRNRRNRRTRRQSMRRNGSSKWQMATSRRVRQVTPNVFPPVPSDPPPENCPMVSTGAPDMTTPSTKTNGGTWGRYGPRRATRAARTGAPASRPNLVTTLELLVPPPSLALPLPVELPNSQYWKQPPKTWWTGERSAGSP